MAGIPGSLLTLLGTITPPLITITVIAGFYSAIRSSPIVAAALYGMQAGVAAIIVDVIVTMASKVIRSKSRSSILIMLAAFIVGALTAFSVSYIIFQRHIGRCVFLGKKTKMQRPKTKEERGGIIMLYAVVSLYENRGSKFRRRLRRALIEERCPQSMADSIEYTDLLTISEDARSYQH